MEVYIGKIRTKINISELENAFKSPMLIHSVLCWPKMWSKNSYYSNDYSACKKRIDCQCTKYYNIWHNLANTTDYYDDIKKLLSK